MRNGRNGQRSHCQDIDLVLAVLGAYDEELEIPVTLPGQVRSQRELADLCGCTWQNIYRIEHNGLKKLRNRLYFLKDEALSEAIEHFIGRRPSL